MQRSPKIENALAELRRLLRADPDAYDETKHARVRMQQRDINRREIHDVLRNSGVHESRKDQFHESTNDWTYAIRGRTRIGRELRIAIALRLDSNGVVVVTVIDLE